MIRHSLRCAEDHAFDSWFQSAAAYESLVQASRVSCPVCDSTRIEKTLMTPAVRPARRSAVPGPQTDGTPALATPATEVERALAALRRKVEENSEYVGMNFVTEARAIHDGEAPERPIYGEAKAEEARKLIEDGVPVAPLPFLPMRKVN